MKLYKVILGKPKTFKESYEQVKKLHKEDPETFLSPEEWVKLQALSIGSFH